MKILMSDRSIADFQKPKAKKEAPDPWTPEAILAVAKKIIAELGINGEIADK